MNSIQLTQTQQAIVRLLIEKPEGRFSIRQIARVLGKSYTLTYHNIQDLINKNFAARESVPPAQIIRLHDRAPIHLLVETEQGRAYEFRNRFPWCDLYLTDVLKEAPHSFFILLVFGSYAKGTSTKGSDLDTLIIIPHNGEIPSFENAARQYTKVKKNVIVITHDDFLGMIQNPTKFNVGNEVKKAHIILYGAEAYYQLLEKTR